MWVQCQQSFHPKWGGPRRPALDRISRDTQDCWAPRQFVQGHQAAPYKRPDLLAQKSATSSEIGVQAQDQRGGGLEDVH
jgi:hypothetical protein